MTQQLVYKILVGGDGGTGKTTLLHRYVEGTFLANTKLTVGIEFHEKKLKLNDGAECSLILWDCGGQDQFRTLITGYTRGAVAALILVDLTRYTTLMSLKEWVNIFRHEDPNLPILLVGTKTDLKDKITVHDDNVLPNLSEYKFFDYIKISSKTGDNVEKCFQIVMNKILDEKFK